MTNEENVDSTMHGVCNAICIDRMWFFTEGCGFCT